MARTDIGASPHACRQIDDDGLYRGHGERVPDVRSIAVLRANAVGDFVIALPALAALRRTYPHARIALLGRAWHASFLRGRPSPVDETIVVPDCIGLGQPAPDGIESLEIAAAFVATMRARRFDLALQLHGGGANSNPLVRSFGARVSAGLCAADAEPLDRNLPYREPHSEALRMLEAVALVGAHGRSVEPRLDVIDADREEAARVVPPDGRPIVVLQPACRDPRRTWSAERFAAVADRFAARGALVAVNGTAAEASITRRVCAAMRAPALDLSGRLSVGGLLGLLERARLVVSNDTGTAHLARALGTPSVTIFWVGNVIGYAPTSCARHAIAVSWRLDCPRCGAVNVKSRCPHDDSFVDDVSVEEVMGAAEGLWRLGER